MSCCGQKRAALRTGSVNTRAQRNSNATSRAPAEAVRPEVSGTALLNYLGVGTIALRGTQTGRVYYFVEGSQATVVHEKDADALLRTRLFARVSGSPISSE